MEAYLDNSATTRVSEEVVALMEQVYRTDYGNPSSRHEKGVDAERYIKEAKEQIAATLKCTPAELIFTSGGTESNNMALIGAALAAKRSGMHIITTCFEHPSVHEPLFYLESLGFRVTYLPVDAKGKVDLQALEDAVCEETVLVSVMYVNNEIGAVQDIAAISNIIKKKREALGLRHEILFHVDAIQAFGKYVIYPKRLGIDLLSVSAHKLHGPKGAGFLYCRDKVKLQPILFGGGQQKGLRSGTENVPGIAGLGLAVKLAYQELSKKTEYLYELKKYFIEGLQEIEGVTVHALPEEITQSAPHIVSVGFLDVRSEVLLHALEERGIYVSSGSACASNHPDISGTLQAIGVEKKWLDATLRFSFSVTTTKEELTYTLEQLKELLPVLRRFKRA